MREHGIENLAAPVQGQRIEHADQGPGEPSLMQRSEKDRRNQE